MLRILHAVALTVCVCELSCTHTTAKTRCILIELHIFLKVFHKKCLFIIEIPVVPEMFTPEEQYGRENGPFSYTHKYLFFIL